MKKEKLYFLWHFTPFFVLLRQESMKQSLSARLTYRIMAVLLVMMAIIAGVVYYTVREYMRDEAKERYLNILLENRQEMRRWLSDVYVAVNNNVHEIERDIDDPDKMFAHVERIVRLNPSIACCAILFEQNYYPSKGKVFVPCARRDSKDSIRVSRIDSTYNSYFYGEWFQEQMKEDKNGWTKPYFESKMFAGDQEPRLLTTYTVPIHNRDGRAVALLGADMSLEKLRSRLMEDVKEINDKYENGHQQQSYFIVVDTEGTLIIHPDKQRIMTGYDARIGRAMKANHGTCTTEVDGVKSRLYYRNIKHTNWVMVLVTPEDVILSNGLMLNLTILAVMVLGLVAIYLFCRRQIKEIADPFAAQKAAMERELVIAHDIQMGMAPKPLTIDHSPLTIDASLTPARDVGGDLYDYFVRDNHLFFCIGDVSGKGVPAALVMATACSAFRLLAEKETEPERIASHMNDTMTRNNDLCIFVTFFVGVLDLNTGKLRYCNAGHKAPYILREKGKGESEKLNVESEKLVDTIPVERNLPLGVMPGWEFKAQETVLESGTTLFLYTDGLDEAEDAQHHMFGKERIRQTLQQESSNDPHTLIEHMTLAVTDFVGGNEQSDDLTMMAIHLSEK